MLFDTINYLLFERRKPELDNELLAYFEPYIVTRYMTFSDPNFVEYTNESLNKYSQIFNSKEDQFRFFENIIPRTGRKQIDYVKKPKEEKVKEDVVMSAVPEFYSKREMEMFDKAFVCGD